MKFQDCPFLRYGFGCSYEMNLPGTSKSIDSEVAELHAKAAWLTMNRQSLCMDSHWVSDLVSGLTECLLDDNSNIYYYYYVLVITIDIIITISLGMVARCMHICFSCLFGQYASATHVASMSSL